MELGSSQWFGKQIGDHAVGLNMVQLHMSILHRLAKVCNPRGDVLQSTAGCVVLREKHSRVVVAEQDGRFVDIIPSDEGDHGSHRDDGGYGFGCRTIFSIT